MIPEARLQGIFDIWEEQGEKSVCPIEGNCMSPMIWEGNILVIEHGAQDIRIGDIVVFGSPGEFFVHRVVHIDSNDEKETFLLKADQNETFHEPVSREEILGKVIEVRGSNGQFRLNSFFWSNVNYILSIRSYISARRLEADTVLWKAANYFYIIKSKIIPDKLRIGRVIWRGICGTHKVWNSITTFGMAGKARE